MTRNALSEYNIIIATSEVGDFSTGATVSISVYKNGSGTAETLSSNSCTEIATTGVFWWGFMNLDSAPSVFSDYKWIMTDGSNFASGSERFGGWPDSVSNLAGANTVTITVEDDQVVPAAIEGVRVAVYNSDNTLLLDSKDTDSNGDAVFYLDDASYKVRLQKSQVSFTVPEDLTVSGTTSDTYTGSPLTIVSQAGASECEVSMFVSSQRPTIALSKLEGTAQITTLPTLIGGVYYSGQKIDGTYDATNKRIYWILPQSSVVEFNVTEILSTTKVSKFIPASSSANFQDLDDR